MVAIAALGVFIFGSSTAAGFECSSVVTPAPSAAPSAGESPRLGQPEPDMGRTHIAAGTNIRYTYCPPASGPHVNQAGFGPLQPNAYGPDDRSQPQGWVHNLEHGGLVVLYSCTKGACDDATQNQLRQFFRDFPTSDVCHTPPGFVGPVIARFEQMPTKFAALVWGRVLFLDTLDTAKIVQFFQTEAERLNADKTGFISPPEVTGSCQAVLQQLQSAAPSAGASPAATAESSVPVAVSQPPAGSASAAPSTSGSPSGAAPSASPSSS
ncbi:MAG: DUF3105 domain-containing protein [Chloroflexota bacterium]